MRAMIHSRTAAGLYRLRVFSVPKPKERISERDECGKGAGVWHTDGEAHLNNDKDELSPEGIAQNGAIAEMDS